MDIDTTAHLAGVRLEAHDSLRSTNEEALVRARAGERAPLWIAARRQTAGRGRRGRAWASEPGNLYASLLLTDPSPPERAAELSFVAALAVHDAIVELAPVLGPHLAVKWPNDLLVDGAKVGGILVEGESAGARALAVVVGVGINCANHPGNTPYPATDLAAAGAVVSPDALLRALSRTMLVRLAQWDRGAGFAEIRADWLKRAAGIGSVIRVALADGEVAGRFQTLDQAGRLMLQLPDGATRTITAGDVFPVRDVA